ncbi:MULTISPECIES: hypothetical protein [Flavobacterium]|uniref:Uncharacterized protein n=1 Tax=Flavobacterium jumunjinense TaxID=998845 RepID=A0ABV5GHS3_9FLAO|nr:MULTISPECIES: hypothetical protein [Flavobacterium]
MKGIVVIFLLVFISCKDVSGDLEIAGNTFYFENPQPINDSELKSFPNKFLGSYMDLDSTFLIFQKEYIFKEYYDTFKVSNNFLDSLKLEYDILESEIVSKNYKDVRFPFRKLKDSIEITDIRIDTIFQFSDFQKAKRINGNLVISEKDSIYWNVKMFIFDKDKLIVKQLYSDSDLFKMDSITATKSRRIDSTTFVIAPKRNEFKQFFKLKNFGYDSNYSKIKK